VNFVHLLSRLHIGLYRLLGGRLVGRVGKAPVLLLTTTGRRSGRSRTAPLLYVRDGETFALAASYGGQPRHPAWYLNLTANPHARVEVGRRSLDVIARTTDGEERERLWQSLVAIYPAYERYRGRTERTIPVVVLVPA
jgi:F420H(2)-dependent quinone reductase